MKKKQATSVKIDNHILVKCRKLAEEEGRTLAGQLRIMLIRALVLELGKEHRK